MPAAASSLIDAVDRYPSTGQEENRLTELFATVLAGDADLVAWLAGKAWRIDQALAQRWAAVGYRVSTQAVISEAERPDMLITFLGPERPPANGRLFCEHKLTAAETAPQRASYPGLRPADRVIAIKSAYGAALTGFGRSVTWSEVAAHADLLARRAVGMSGRGRRWRSQLREPGAPALQWRRYELIQYLSRKDPGVAQTDPLSTFDVSVYARARAMLFRARDLFRYVVHSEQLRDRLGDEPGTHRQSQAPDDPPFELKEAKDSWYKVLREMWPAVVHHPGTYWVELLISPYDDWVPEPKGEPAVGVGYCFDLVDGAWPEGLSPGGTWAERMAEDMITVSAGDEGKIGRCFMTLYLGELAARGLSLSEQGEWAAGWAREALATIERHDQAEPRDGSGPNGDPP
jgi:hypothetical protein